MFNAIKQAFLGKAGTPATILAYFLVLLTSLAIYLGVPNIESRVEANAKTSLVDNGYSQALADTVVVSGRDVSISPVVGGDDANNNLTDTVEAASGIRWARLDSDATAIQSLTSSTSTSDSSGTVADAATTVAASIVAGTVAVVATADSALESTGDGIKKVLAGQGESSQETLVDTQVAAEGVVAKGSAEVFATDENASEEAADVATNGSTNVEVSTEILVEEAAPVAADTAVAAPIMTTGPAAGLTAYFQDGNLNVNGVVPDQEAVSGFTRALTQIRRTGLTTIEIRQGSTASDLSWQQDFLGAVAGIPNDATGKITANDQSGVEIVPGTEQVAAQVEANSELEAVSEADNTQADVQADVSVEKAKAEVSLMDQAASVVAAAVVTTGATMTANVTGNAEVEAPASATLAPAVEAAAEVVADSHADMNNEATVEVVAEVDAPQVEVAAATSEQATEGNSSVSLAIDSGEAQTTAVEGTTGVVAQLSDVSANVSIGGEQSMNMAANSQSDNTVGITAETTDNAAQSQWQNQNSANSAGNSNSAGGFSMGMNVDSSGNSTSQSNYQSQYQTEQVTRAPQPAIQQQALSNVDQDGSAGDRSPLDYIVNLNYALTGKPVFESGQAEISPAFATKLQELVGFLNAYPNTLLRVVGNVDFSLDSRDGEYAGILRARAVRDYLRQQGIDSFRIFAAPLPRGYAFDEQTQIVFYISE